MKAVLIQITPDTYHELKDKIGERILRKMSDA